MCPFIFLPTMASYSVMWVVRTIEEGEALVQEHTYALKSADDVLKSVQMAVWNGVPQFDRECRVSQAQNCKLHKKTDVSEVSKCIKILKKTVFPRQLENIQ